MKITKADIVHSGNMIKALAKGKWELDGMEILAFADMMRWFSNLQNKMEVEFAQEEAEAKAKAERDAKLEGKFEIKPTPVTTVDPQPITPPAPPAAMKKMPRKPVAKAKE